jgi:hypothetical protein
LHSKALHFKFTIGSHSDRSTFKAQPLGPRKAMNVSAQYDDLQVVPN